MGPQASTGSKGVGFPLELKLQTAVSHKIGFLGT